MRFNTFPHAVLHNGCWHRGLVIARLALTLPFLLQGCDDSFLAAFPPMVFEYTGGIPRLILWTYMIVFAWTHIRHSRDGDRAKKLTVGDIPQALEHVFDYLYNHRKVRCCCVTGTAQCATQWV